MSLFFIDGSYGRGGGVGRGLGVNAGLGVGEGLGVEVGVAVGIGVGLGVANCAQYLAPVFKMLPLDPPHTIISWPVHTGV